MPNFSKSEALIFYIIVHKMGPLRRWQSLKSRKCGSLTPGRGGDVTGLTSKLYEETEGRNNHASLVNSTLSSTSSLDWSGP